MRLYMIMKDLAVHEICEMRAADAYVLDMSWVFWMMFYEVIHSRHVDQWWSMIAWKKSKWMIPKRATSDTNSCPIPFFVPRQVESISACYAIYIYRTYMEYTYIYNSCINVCNKTIIPLHNKSSSFWRSMGYCCLVDVLLAAFGCKALKMAIAMDRSDVAEAVQLGLRAILVSVTSAFSGTVWKLTPSREFQHYWGGVIGDNWSVRANSANNLEWFEIHTVGDAYCKITD